MQDKSIMRLHVVLEGEDDKEENKLEGVCDGYREEELQQVLEEFSDMFSDEPGNTKVVEVSINTGEEQPFRLAPYTVHLGIRDKVKAEIEALLKSGIIERSDNPWASPLMLVRKKDGGIRSCHGVETV